MNPLRWIWPEKVRSVEEVQQAIEDREATESAFVPEPPPEPKPPQPTSYVLTRSVKVKLKGEPTVMDLVAEKTVEPKDRDDDPLHCEDAEIYFWQGDECYCFPYAAISYYILGETEQRPKYDEPENES